MEQSPHRLWYVMYILFWIPAGIACYFVWKDRDKEEAKRQFWYSTWLGIFVWLMIGTVIEFLLFPVGLIFG